MSDNAFRRAQDIARGALKIDWWDTETAARRVAEYAADIPATDAQAMQNEKVKALVCDAQDFLSRLSGWKADHLNDKNFRDYDGHVEPVETRLRAALAAIKEEQDDG